MGERRFTAKILTTAQAPEDGVLAALRSVTARAGVEPGQVDLIVHGTTLATNALIERKGARTALLTTEGFRDVLEPPRKPLRTVRSQHRSAAAARAPTVAP